jgi:hypothetical protein
MHICQIPGMCADCPKGQYESSPDKDIGSWGYQRLVRNVLMLVVSVRGLSCQVELLQFSSLNPFWTSFEGR